VNDRGLFGGWLLGLPAVLAALLPALGGGAVTALPALCTSGRAKLSGLL
jgi:hypothetical protein